MIQILGKIYISIGRMCSKILLVISEIREELSDVNK